MGFLGGRRGSGGECGVWGDGQVAEKARPMIEVLERTSREVFLSRITLSRLSRQGGYLTGHSIAVFWFGTS